MVPIYLSKAIFQHALITYSHASCSKISPLCLLLGETTTRLDQYLPYFLSSHPQLHSCFPPDHPCIRLAGWLAGWLPDCILARPAWLPIQAWLPGSQLDCLVWWKYWKACNFIYTLQYENINQTGMFPDTSTFFFLKQKRCVDNSQFLKPE